MEVESYKKNGRILVRPVKKSDLPLFKHCANGSSAVTTRVFNAEVKPLLFKHGLWSLTHVVNTSIPYKK